MAFGASDRIPILGRRWGGKCDYETVRKSLDASLARLNLSYVDLYYTHRVPSKESGTCTFREDFRPPPASHRPCRAFSRPPSLPLVSIAVSAVEFVTTAKRLIEEGLIKHIGISEMCCPPPRPGYHAASDDTQASQTRGPCVAAVRLGCARRMRCIR